LFALSQGDWTGWVASGVRSLRVLLLSDRFNPPRFVRRTRRLANRLLTGEVKLPRFAATMTTALLLCGFGGYGIIAGGYLPAVFASVSSSAGFAIDHVAVSGQRETSEIDVLGQIELDGSTSMFGFDVDAARRRIIELPWVKDAAVTKIYPDTVRVKLTERKAYAIWQRDDELTLIDSSGVPIVAFREARYAGLPLVVGAGAATKAEDFVTLVQSHPDLAGKVISAFRTGGGICGLKAASRSNCLKSTPAVRSTNSHSWMTNTACFRAILRLLTCATTKDWF
jgi:cell division protein FtsQ